MSTVKQRPLDAMVAATPSTRDRYVDFLRAASISVVVLGHWLMAVIMWRGGSFTGTSALDEIEGLWALTWVLQVMPLFFFVGGFSNLMSWDAVRRRGGSYADWLSSRIERLLRPTLVFVGSWIALAVLLDVIGGDLGEQILRASGLIAKPLWFLAVYVLAVAAAPAMLRLHRRFGIRVVLVMGAAAVVVDSLRLGAGLEAIGYLNFVFVWLIAHQLGFFYAGGSLPRLGARVHSLIAAGGIVAVALLTTIGPYSNSMVGTAGREASNNSPPSVCLIALTFWLVGLAMFLRPRITRWLAQPGPWKAVVAANSVIMTAFLWHLTALLLAAAIVFPLGWPQPSVGSGGWWIMRPLWVALLLVALVPFLGLFGRFERPRSEAGSPDVPDVRRGRRSWSGLALLTIGLSGFALAGFKGVLDPPGLAPPSLHTQPLLNGLCLLVGARLLNKGPAR
ncbi:MAG: acyltransferase [Actinomycetota bacterium]|nr:acyltransferase [Actinomycetota bacterium]